MQTYKLNTATVKMEDGAVISVELPNKLDTDTPDSVGIPLPEIVALIALLDRDCIELLSDIKGNKHKQFLAMNKIIMSELCDSDVVAILKQIRNL